MHVIILPTEKQYKPFTSAQTVLYSLTGLILVQLHHQCVTTQKGIFWITLGLWEYAIEALRNFLLI